MGNFRTKVTIKCFCEYKRLFRARKTGVEAVVSKEAQNTHGKDSQGLVVSKKAFHTHKIVLAPASRAIPCPGAYGRQKQRRS